MMPYQCLKKALASCLKERKREGVALKKDLNHQLQEITKVISRMQKLRTAANNELKKRFNSKLEKWQNLNYDPQRLAQELTINLDKVDINEEMSRLKEHIRSCKALIAGADGRGKKLDFYSQELLREVNTIGSKSQVSKLTEEVVNAKSIIERFREQVQNIE